MSRQSIRSTDQTRSEGLDKFYTIVPVSKKCISTVSTIYLWDSWDLIIEPSAGNGNFFTNIPVQPSRKIGIDISPEHVDIIKGDFLEYNPPPGKILVIGNPPFGKNSSLAVKFFNHAALWSQTIAFIVPRTFRRESIQNRLNLGFKLILDEDISSTPCSFNPPMSAKCCFQVWERTIEDARTIVNLATTHADWEFLPFGPIDSRNQPTPPLGADFAIRAYGGKCGEIRTANLHLLRPKSWHWIRCPDKETLMERFGRLDYSSSMNTARQNSMGRGELVKLYAVSCRPQASPAP